MADTLSGKTAFITGGGGGLGAAAAKLLAGDGAAVVLMGRRKQLLEDTRAKLLAAHPSARVEIHAGDALNVDELGAGLEMAKAISGNLDILVGTVGGISGMNPAVKTAIEAFRHEIEINLMSTIIAVKLAAPMMTNGGSMIFISSAAAANPFPYMSGYATAKAGMEHFIRTVADELGPDNIRVNCVRAGIVRTELAEELFQNKQLVDSFLEQATLGRLGVPDDVAHAIRYLAGPESSWVTGHALTADGGQTLRRNPDLGFLCSP